MPRARNQRHPNPEICTKGEPIATAICTSSHTDVAAIERWVRAVASVAQAQLDWHWAQHIQIKHLGDDASYHRARGVILALSGHGGVRVLQTYPCRNSGSKRQDR